MGTQRFSRWTWVIAASAIATVTLAWTQWHVPGAGNTTTRRAANDATIAALLASDQPEQRAAGCVQIARRARASDVGALVPRMSDNDWRVRAAAFEAVQAIARDVPAVQGDVPLRDTVPEDRERLIFRWIKALPSLPETCELYLPPAHWLAGPVLGESCLTCHAPRDAGVAASAKCLTCHADVEPSWGPSAHAWSTTHLHLSTIAAVTKDVVPWDHGDRKGVGCAGCHAPAPGIAGFDADHPFARGVAASSCATCHTDEQRQWEQWRTREHPIAANWPPGEVTTQRPEDSQSCVDCHVPPRSSVSPVLGHNFGTRRDVGFLHRGLQVRLEQVARGRPPQVVLTNLSGHEYPTGTVRRTLRLEATWNDDPATRRVIARLAPAYAGPTTRPTDPALAVGEQRRIDVPAVDGAFRVTVDVVYERNRFVPGSYEAVIDRVQQDLAPGP